MSAAVLSAKFSAIDEISTVFDKVANSGANAIDQWETANNAINKAFEQATTGAESLSKASQNAADSTDYWTSKLGSYDSAAMEAVFTTSDLVEMGYKAQAALDAETEASLLCAQASEQLSKSTDIAVNIQEELARANNEAAQVMEKVEQNDKIAAETKEELSKASERAANAANELATAQTEAAKATEELSVATSTATASQDDLEKAAERVAHAAEALSEANGKAMQSTGELSSATAKATEEHEKLGKSGPDSIKNLESILVAAGLAKLVSEITDAVIKLGNEFSNAESIIIKSTGATGAELNSLNSSMMDIYATAKTNELSTVAGAIGEINTRLGSTGDELNHITNLFLDFSRITDTQVVGSVQNVTKVMKNWGVDIDECPG